MTTAEYIQSLEGGLEQILQDPKFNNHRNQLSAWKLSAAFSRSYDERYLWNRALFLSTNGCQLMLHGDNVRLATRSLRESALIYENLFHISEVYDKEFALMLSALCYDLAGYQANAVCLIKKVETYQFITDDQQVETSSDNYILQHFRQILLKNIPLANNLINRNLDNDPGIRLFNDAALQWYQQVLTGIDTDFLGQMDKVYHYYLNAFNIPISQLIFLLKTRLKLYVERSIWYNLNNIAHINQHPTWTKYIKLLTNNIYDGRRIKNLERRLSKFEFWTSQLRAVQKGVLDSDESFVIQMPTSAGKTFIAELTILNALIKHPGAKCLYISPFRALTNEKEGELSDNLSKLGFSVSALSGNYEIDEFQDIILSDTDVLIATPEKIDLLLRLNPSYFQQIALAVVDEGHILGDISSRSSLLEFLIIRLKMTRPGLKILFISAVMPPANADEYSVWLSNSAGNVIRSSLHPDSPPAEEWEPTRKLIGRFDWNGNNGRISYKDMSTQDEATNAVTPSFISAIIRKRQYGGTLPDGIAKAQTSAALAFRLSQDGNTLVFCAQVKNTDQVGTALLNLLAKMRETAEAIPTWFTLNTDRESYFYARKWYGPDSYISQCLSHGIGVHFGDLPEAVRRSVEEDFVKGYLKVLISTNTIGQGLNFPIKNLVIHSTLITVKNKIQIKVEVRDFWNIIGRAGRAGMETEGQIIFNVKSWTDEQEFARYTNKANIDAAYSLFFNVLNALVDGRITQRTFENNIKILAEPYILNLITEESIGTDDEDTINSILQNSLFMVQCQANQIEVEPIKNTFRNIFASIKEDNTIEEIRTYAETGLCLKSNKAIDKFITENSELLKAVIEGDNYLAFIELCYQLFDEASLDELDSEKFDKLKLDFVAFIPVTRLWVEGADIDILQNEWANISDNSDHLNILIAQGFYYLFPWIISAFLTLVRFKLNLEQDDLPEDIANVISYIKYGLEDIDACLLKSMGIKNRDVAMLLSDHSLGLSGRALIRWVANLNENDIDQLDISVYDKQNILSVALKLTPQKFENIPDELEFDVKGINFDEDSKFISSVLVIGDKLNIARELTNQFDPYAIEISLDNSKLGYVPREYAKVLSVEIDLNASTYELTVIGISPIADYYDIKVKMLKI
ncbi:DEAD/DEAH box helicase [Mucilaginibacter sp. HMF5004]|uniref:DEAD/DEAH box helicase n=1 Tax=Mucilaginibacter rivuli TaxID=2857527 RepID=UPI001C5E4EB0|nr:DEAD/DEAH box helicase [Mucilaginibacter rivuli]MBW4888909.1 DEAD/DEAH box helicase [Mucilaginibacter rivuli]